MATKEKCPFNGGMCDNKCRFFVSPSLGDHPAHRCAIFQIVSGLSSNINEMSMRLSLPTFISINNHEVSNALEEAFDASSVLRNIDTNLCRIATALEKISSERI